MSRLEMSSVNFKSFSYYAFNTNAPILSGCDRTIVIIANALLALTFGLGHLVCAVIYAVHKKDFKAGLLRSMALERSEQELRRFENVGLEVAEIVRGGNQIRQNEVHRSHTTSTTNNDRLILAARGTTLGDVALTTMISPIIGLMVMGNYNTPDLEGVEKALRQGANINYQERGSGYTPLIYAAWNGHPTIAEYLLGRGADPKIKENDGYNACTMAKYYLNQYSTYYRQNEVKALTADFNAESKSSMRDHYQQYIDRYQRLVDLLEPVTPEHTKTPNFMSKVIGLLS